MVEYVNGFKCGRCGHIYEDRDDAVDCWKDHDDPEIDKATMFKCSICKKDCEDELEAKKCEENHEKLNDSLWQDYIEEKRKKDLLHAGESKSQKKLI